MKEQDIQKKFIRYVEGEGGYVVKVISASKAGVSDLIICLEGKFISLEVKTPKTKSNVSKLQAYHLSKVEEAGGIAGVAWDMESLREVLYGD